MNEGIERDLGPQPIAAILVKLNLKPHDLVAASTQQLTHKMVSRAAKGRRLTLNTQAKVLNALNLASGKNYSLNDLFNY
jgi:prephenate dehydrogenase